MIIAGFGSTWATAYQFGSAFGTDDWTTERPAVVQRVGGMSGGYDYYGALGYPLAPLTVKKSWSLVPGTVEIGGEGSGIYGTGELYGVGRVWGEAGDYSELYLNMDGAIDYLKRITIGAGESKLWGLLRDGTHRWAWAKCTSLKAAENFRAKTSLPIEVAFMCREGVWYGETAQTVMVANQTWPYTTTVTNAGSHPAMVYTLAEKLITGNMTSVALTNNTNGMTWEITGISEGVGSDVIVDAAAYSCTNYANLALGTGQIVFMQLEPGDNELVFEASSGACAIRCNWYDTYL